MRRASECEHAETQPAGAVILLGAGVLVGVVLLIPVGVLVVLLKLGLFLGLAGFLIACLARSGEL